MRRSRVQLLVLAGALGLAFGCGGADKQYDITGTVTYQEKAVPIGTIFFEPDGSQGVGGPGGIATIHDGQFTTVVAGRGSRGGPHLVRVQGYDGKKSNEAPYGQAIFPEYEFKQTLPNANSELKVVVPARGKVP